MKCSMVHKNLTILQIYETTLVLGVDEEAAALSNCGSEDNLSLHVSTVFWLAKFFPMGYVLAIFRVLHMYTRTAHV